MTSALIDHDPEMHADWWPCACTKRRKGRLVAIRLHDPDTKRCQDCGATKPASKGSRSLKDFR